MRFPYPPPIFRCPHHAKRKSTCQREWGRFRTIMPSLRARPLADSLSRSDMRTWSCFGCLSIFRLASSDFEIGGGPTPEGRGVSPVRSVAEPQAGRAPAAPVRGIPSRRRGRPGPPPRASGPAPGGAAKSYSGGCVHGIGLLLFFGDDPLMRSSISSRSCCAYFLYVALSLELLQDALYCPLAHGRIGVQYLALACACDERIEVFPYRVLV